MRCAMRCVAWRMKVLTVTSCSSPELAGTRHATQRVTQHMWQRRLSSARSHRNVVNCVTNWRLCLQSQRRRLSQADGSTIDPAHSGRQFRSRFLFDRRRSGEGALHARSRQVSSRRPTDARPENTEKSFASILVAIVRCARLRSFCTRTPCCCRCRYQTWRDVIVT